MTSKWKKLADRIAGEIRGGERAPGTALPHIRTLVEDGEGSLATVHRAYKDLEARGYVTSVRGHGTVVRDTQAPPRLPLYRHAPGRSSGRTQWESAVAEAGLTGQVSADSPELLDASPCVSDALGLDAGAPVVHIRYHVRVGEAVVQRDDAWYPRDLAEAVGLDGTEAREADPLGLLARAGLLSGALEQVRAEFHTFSPEELSDDAPELSGRGAVLRIERVTKDSSGRVVEYVSTLTDAARAFLSYSLPLSRSGHPPKGQKPPR